jgi:hypothetical protein
MGLRLACSLAAAVVLLFAVASAALSAQGSARPITGAALDWRASGRGEQVLVQPSGEVVALVGESAPFLLGSQVRFLARPVACVPAGAHGCFAMVRVLTQFVGPVMTTLLARFRVLSAGRASVTVSALASPAASPRLTFTFPTTGAVASAARTNLGRTATLTLSRRKGGATGAESSWNPYSWTVRSLIPVGAPRVVVDQTVLCTTRSTDPPFVVTANTATHINGAPVPAGASVQSGQTALVAFSLGLPFAIHSYQCVPAHAGVPLSPRGLQPSIYPHSFNGPCYPHGRILVRARVTETNGRVNSGTLAVRMLTGNRPIFYAQISSSRHTTIDASARDCNFA